MGICGKEDNMGRTAAQMQASACHIRKSACAAEKEVGCCCCFTDLN
jgi:hypothetical protein